MHINDLRNLLVLARKGISVLSEQMPSQEAEAAWGSIKNAEAFVANIIEKQQAAQEAEGGDAPAADEADGTEVHVVDLDADGGEGAED